ncbi:hypothetical protein NDU88_004228 [Pleurodeles waltl]|uniref:Uncharacterized protein n=1 Tax=Pleurodeles waltl TaxID=8319 RepID=A0AAV7T7J9_PLEWA|nr:hypothetical protein NDU88_004228 [Pleurodeles waltl]
MDNRGMTEQEPEAVYGPLGDELSARRRAGGADGDRCGAASGRGTPDLMAGCRREGPGESGPGLTAACWQRPPEVVNGPSVIRARRRGVRRLEPAGLGGVLLGDRGALLVDEPTGEPAVKWAEREGRQRNLAPLDPG